MSVVLTMGNISVDIQKYAKRHPGGYDILHKLQDRGDVMHLFEDIGHSKMARQKARAMGFPLSDETGSTPYQKLITREDYQHIHKILGVVSICHLLPRIGLAIWYGMDVFQMYLGPLALTSLACLQLLLSLSSVQFHVPQTPNIHSPMIHQTFRSHSIIFAIRAVLCTLSFIWLEGWWWSMVLRGLVVLGTMVAADTVTNLDTSTFRTTRTMPYWPGAREFRQVVHRSFYAWAQFGATSVCIVGSESLALSTLIAIQGAALLMTLNRKSIISPYTYHMVYSAQLLVPILLVLATVPVTTFLIIGMNSNVLYILRIYGRMNKYLLWTLYIMYACIWHQSLLLYFM